jgi:hypothetical protein
MVQVKVALCQLHVTADKDQNIRTARAAIQVRGHPFRAAAEAARYTALEVSVPTGTTA